MRACPSWTRSGEAEPGAPGRGAGAPRGHERPCTPARGAGGAAPSAVPGRPRPRSGRRLLRDQSGFVSAAAAAHFANPRNDFWRLLHAAGFTPRLLRPDEQFESLDYGIGLTNAAPRTTRGSGDLRRGDFAGAAARLDRLALEFASGVIAFVGKEAYRGTFGERPEHGLQERRLGETRLFVLPSTSPANAAIAPGTSACGEFLRAAEARLASPTPIANRASGW